MMKFANNTFALLADPISPTDTLFVLEAGSGEQFPSLGTNEYFYLTLYRVVEGEEICEIVKVTGRTGDLLTAERGVDDTIARSWITGTRCEMRNNAAIFRDITAFIGDTSSVLDGVLGV